jgi:hypothetical protein
MTSGTIKTEPGFEPALDAELYAIQHSLAMIATYPETAMALDTTTSTTMLAARL